MILNGLGGKELSTQHAVNSAKLCNELQPEFLSTLVLSYPHGMEHFKERLLKELLENDDFTDSIYALTDRDLTRIKNLQEEKYLKWEWNYGESPTSTNIKAKRYPGGKIEFHFDLDGGMFKNIKIFGDFLDIGDTKKLVDILEHTPFEINAIRQKLHALNVSQIINNISNDDIVDCLMS